MLRVPRPAPRWNSPSPAMSASFARCTLAPVARLSIFTRGAFFQGRLGGLTRTPRLMSMGPGAPMAMLVTFWLPRRRSISAAAQSTRPCGVSDESCAADHRLPPCARQGTCDSTSPEIDVAKGFLGYWALQTDISHGHPASRLEHPEDLPIDADLVRAEVDHAIRNHDIRPPIVDGQIFDQTFAKLDIVQSQPG